MALTRKQKRLSVIAGLGVVLAISVGLILMALRDQIVFFYSPSEIAEMDIEAGVPIRLGGLVKDQSWRQQGEINLFVVTDGESEMAASFTGIMPDLFREGQGVVAEGAILPDGTFLASNVLAKHDETYMPREVADTLRMGQSLEDEGSGEYAYGVSGQ